MSSFCRTLVCARCADRTSRPAGPGPPGLVDLHQVVVHVTEERPRPVVHERHPVPGEPDAREPGQRLRERSRGPAELQDLPLEGVDPRRCGPRAAAGRREHRGLQLLQVGLQLARHVHVVVDHRVRDRVQHRRRSVPQHLRLLLKTVPYGRQWGLHAVPDGHYEGVAHEDHDLAGGDHVAVRLVAHRFEDHEQRVVVDLQLGALMRGQGVLDGQRVQGELLGDAVELLLRGLVEADPDEGVADATAVVEAVGEVAGPLRPASVAVDGVVDDHGAYSPAVRPKPHPRVRLPFTACPR